MEFIKIDGSFGYGQVLRTALALSSLTLKPFKIFNIRIKRPNPGLRPQHLSGVKVAAKFASAEVKGAKIGSLELTFIPKRYKIPEYEKIDIGTAGSITLLLQSIFPLIVFSGKEVKLEIIGGTDVRGAPTTIYFQKVFSYFLQKLGINFYSFTFKHGFYPKGNGKFFVKVYPLEKEISSISLIERGNPLGIELWSVASLNLKKAKVAERQLEGFKQNFDLDIPINAYFRYDDTLSPGSSLNAHFYFENCLLGKDGLGEKGKRAEEVGKEVALELKKSYDSNACLDKFMADQILPFLALAKGKSEIKIEEFTEHVESNISTIEKFLDVKFEIDKEEKIIKVKGIGFKPIYP